MTSRRGFLRKALGGAVMVAGMQLGLLRWESEVVEEQYYVDSELFISWINHNTRYMEFMNDLYFKRSELLGKLRQAGTTDTTRELAMEGNLYAGNDN